MRKKEEERSKTAPEELAEVEKARKEKEKTHEEIAEAKEVLEKKYEEPESKSSQTVSEKVAQAQAEIGRDIEEKIKSLREKSTGEQKELERRKQEAMDKAEGARIGREKLDQGEEYKKSKGLLGNFIRWLRS